MNYILKLQLSNQIQIKVKNKSRITCLFAHIIDHTAHFKANAYQPCKWLGLRIHHKKEKIYKRVKIHWIIKKERKISNWEINTGINYSDTIDGSKERILHLFLLDSQEEVVEVLAFAVEEERRRNAVFHNKVPRTEK